MSVLGGPNIITDGLVLALDPGNKKSYPGSGTTWTDLSTNDTTGTLYNSVDYNSENGGSLVFDGTNYVEFENATELQFLNTSPYTLEVWMYPTANPGGSKWTGIFNRESNEGSGRDGYNMYLNGSDGTTMYLSSERFGTGTQKVAFASTNEATLLNKWHHMVATYNGSELRLYRNTVELGSAGPVTQNITNTSRTLQIGRRGTSSYFIGRLTCQKIYNKALTIPEITQNYNALKDRFGL